MTRGCRREVNGNAKKGAGVDCCSLRSRIFSYAARDRFDSMYTYGCCSKTFTSGATWDILLRCYYVMDA